MTCPNCLGHGCTGECDESVKVYRPTPDELAVGYEYPTFKGKVVMIDETGPSLDAEWLAANAQAERHPPLVVSMRFASLALRTPGLGRTKEEIGMLVDVADYLKKEIARRDASAAEKNSCELK